MGEQGEPGSFLEAEPRRDTHRKLVSPLHVDQESGTSPGKSGIAAVGMERDAKEVEMPKDSGGATGSRDVPEDIWKSPREAAGARDGLSQEQATGESLEEKDDDKEGEEIRCELCLRYSCNNGN